MRACVPSLLPLLALLLLGHGACLAEPSASDAAWAGAPGVQRLGDCAAQVGFRPPRLPPDAPLLARSPRPLLADHGPGCPPLSALDAGVCLSRNSTVACMPSLVVIGAMKCGTAEIQGWLSRHPHLQRWQGTLPKTSGAGEAHFFDDLTEDGEEFEQQLREKYLYRGMLLPLIDANQTHDYKRWTFEKTPGYMMMNSKQIERFQRVLPSAKLIAIIRLPSARAYSHFQHKCRQGSVYEISGKDVPARHQRRVVVTSASDSRVIRELQQEYNVPPTAIHKLQYPCPPSSFVQLLFHANNGSWLTSIDPHAISVGSILRRGFYADQLQKFLAAGFQRSQLLILLTEELFDDFIGVIDRVQQFLGVPYFNYSQLTMVNERGFTVLQGMESKANKRTYTPLPLDFRQLLDEYYAASTEALAAFVPKDKLDRYWHRPQQTAEEEAIDELDDEYGEEEEGDDGSRRTEGDGDGDDDDGN